MPRTPKNKKSPLGAILDSIVKNPSGIESVPRSDNRGPRPMQSRRPQGRPLHQHHSHAPRPQHSFAARPTHSAGAAPVAGTTPHHAHPRPTQPSSAPSHDKKHRTGTFQYNKRPGRGAKSEPSQFRHSSRGEEKKPDGERSIKIGAPAADTVRVIPLGGVEEIGKNMTAIEIGDDIIIIDAGFQFKTEDTPGIDYIIPNTKYLEERKDKIRGMIVTHGHMDHIGAIPYIIDKIGNPPIYTRRLTAIMIKRRQEEFPHVSPLDMRIVEKEDKVRLGNSWVRFFGVSHSIPDSMGVIIETPWGNVIGTGDLRVDNRQGVPTDSEEEAFSQLGKENNLLLMMDSTNATNPGFSLAESVVIQNIENIVRDVPGRLIIGTFASQLQRIMSIIEVAERLGKKVVVEGRSMKLGIEIVTELGLLKPGKGTIIPVEDVGNYPDEKILMIATGSQGEEFAAIMRISNKTHKHFHLKKGDTVLLSSSVIPGNEMGVQKVKDNLSRQGARIIHYKISEIHASGHANADELAWIHKKLQPKFFMPVHGYHYMLTVHAEIARSQGIPEENIAIADNGSIVEIVNGEKLVIRKEKVPASIVMVDGFSIGDMQDVVIRDRQMLAQDGMFVIVATVDSETGKLKKSPDIISRGFVYLKESQDLLHHARHIVKKTVEDTMKDMHPANFEYTKNAIGDNLSKYLFQKTAKRPLVIPVLLSV